MTPDEYLAIFDHLKAATRSLEAARSVSSTMPEDTINSALRFTQWAVRTLDHLCTAEEMSLDVLVAARDADEVPF